MIVTNVVMLANAMKILENVNALVVTQVVIVIIIMAIRKAIELIVLLQSVHLILRKMNYNIIYIVYYFIMFIYEFLILWLLKKNWVCENSSFFKFLFSLVIHL